MKKLVFAILLALTPTLTLLAQDPVFTQAYSAGMYLNPALAGEQKGFKLNINHRNQWPSISGFYKTTNIGLQKRWDKYGWGFGIMFQGDNSSDVIFTSNLGLVISKWFRINDKTSLSFGLNSSYQSKGVDFSKLTFGDPLDPLANNQAGYQQISYPNFSLGTLFKYKMGNLGLVANNFLAPNQSFYPGGNVSLPMRLTAHHTIEFPLGEKWKIGNTIILHTQAGAEAAITYFTAQYKWLKWCAGYYAGNAAIGGIGLVFPRFNINYTYEYTVSKLTNATGGSHEIGMSFRFGNKKEYGDKGSLSF
ncbi:MAG: PorP/SprF family type IX secretion system membrane protein [Flavobacteriales bacterium]